MATKKVNEMTTEELVKREKLVRMSMIMLAVSSILMLAAGVVLSRKKGFSTFMILPVSFLPLIIVNANSLKEIKKELQARVQK